MGSPDVCFVCDLEFDVPGHRMCVAFVHEDPDDPTRRHFSQPFSVHCGECLWHLRKAALDEGCDLHVYEFAAWPLDPDHIEAVGILNASPA